MTPRRDPMGLFGSVRATDVRSLAGPVVDVRIPAGTELVGEGSLIGTFFVIRSGSAELRRGGRTVGTLGTGDCFGEIDAVAPSPQPYGVVAEAPMRLLAFSAHGIGRLCEAIPGARARILGSLPDLESQVVALPQQDSVPPSGAPVTLRVVAC